MKFEENIRIIYKDKGSIWLENLPILINKLADKWDLSDLIPYENLTCNYILKGNQRQRPIVLKLGIDIETLRREYEALNEFKAYGVVSIIDQDLQSGAILLEQAVPGDSLISLFPKEDIKALAIACRVANSLHKVSIPKNHSFPLLSEWLKIIDKDWDLPHTNLKLARKLKNNLLQKSQSNVLLHGDFHYGNIISHRNSYIAIDPKGVVGDPVYDIAALLRNPLELLMNQPNLDIILKKRIEFAAVDTGQKIETIYAWAYVHTVMSICWSLEDGQDVATKLRFLEILSREMQNIVTNIFF
jgi:streptomycin 6-kinase